MFNSVHTQSGLLGGSDQALREPSGVVVAERKICGYIDGHLLNFTLLSVGGVLQYNRLPLALCNLISDNLYLNAEFKNTIWKIDIKYSSRNLTGVQE